MMHAENELRARVVGHIAHVVLGKQSQVALPLGELFLGQRRIEFGIVPSRRSAPFRAGDAILPSVSENQRRVVPQGQPCAVKPKMVQCSRSRLIYCKYR